MHTPATNHFALDVAELKIREASVVDLDANRSHALLNEPFVPKVVRGGGPIIAINYDGNILRFRTAESASSATYSEVVNGQGEGPRVIETLQSVHPNQGREILDWVNTFMEAVFRRRRILEARCVPEVVRGESEVALCK